MLPVVVWNAARTALASKAYRLLGILCRVGLRWRRRAPLALEGGSVRLMV